jgi:probable phosphoglycerate mutase
MTKIYLVRHAEAEGNLYRIAQGQYDSLITDRGYRQVAALEKRFADIPVDAVYASDLYRTCVTAGAVYIPRRLPLHRRKDLREICVGRWEQKTWGEIVRTEEEQMTNFSSHLDRWRVDGAESPERVRDRMLGAIREIAAENDGKTAAVFSHGCAIRILLATLQGYDIGQIGPTPLGTNTAVSLLEADGADIRVVYRDDASHLTVELTRKRPGKQTRPLDPGLYFEPLRPNRQAAAEALAAEAWADSGRSGTPDLAAGQPGRTLIVGMLPDNVPVGLLCLEPDREAERRRGWISLCCIARDCREQGYGVQLLGQAVQHFRPLGRERLCVAPGPAEAGQRFFRAHGFRPTGETAEDGCPVLEKDISFHPLPDFT